MTIQQLKYIIALDKERHFARAAEACFVSQPALTLQLRSLEEEIGIKIFDRSVVPLRPTPLGEAIIAKAHKVLLEVEAMRTFVIDEKSNLVGEVKLGVISTLAPYLIPLLINKLKEEMPQVHWLIEERNTLQLLSDLELGQLDIALMATPTGKKALKEFPVFYEPFVAFLPPLHPLRTANYFELSADDKANILLLHQEYCFNAQLLDVCSFQDDVAINAEVHYQITSLETLKNMVRANMGLAIVPQLSVAYLAQQDVYKPFKAPQPVREISLVVSERFAKTLLLEKLKACIWACLPVTLQQSFPYKKISWNDSPYFQQKLLR